ncbi:inositol polyphosphate multikinase [Cimex lectularius]|uniref:Kinase n=1 Tax=Cimex lectularius TaxID=79782 RepID=A0A8I6S9H2_CIMLE|nr:inositol polyphosphate multikinase [Cimex lectularius]
MDRNAQKSLPKGLFPYENQVAGHNANPIGVLKSEDGSILKPLLKEPQSSCEVKFYEKINSDTGILGDLRKFTPCFKGTMNLTINDKDIKFLKLEDMTNGAVKPCVMDVKIGSRTWAPDASETKRQTEDRKYMSTKQAYGFCIPGYKVYNLSKNNISIFSKELGKNLTPEEVPTVFKDFLNHSSGHMGFLIDRYLPVMMEMLEWWRLQKVVHLYSSSLLFFYDAHRLEAMNKESTQDCNAWIKIRMIDFAHAVPAESIDSNYTDGLSRLIELLKKLRLEYK